jgi:hypothetical protein
MATPPVPTQPQQIQMRYVDRPEISETYADLLGRVYFDGITLRMEFVVNRLDDSQPGQQGTGRAVTTARVVIPLPGMVDMLGKLQTIMKQLQAAGMVIPMAPGSQSVN